MLSGLAIGNKEKVVLLPSSLVLCITSVSEIKFRDKKWFAPVWVYASNKLTWKYFPHFFILEFIEILLKAGNNESVKIYYQSAFKKGRKRFNF